MRKIMKVYLIVLAFVMLIIPATISYAASSAKTLGDLKKELSNLIDMKRHNVGPFAKGIVENYYLQYQKLKKSK